MNPLITTQVATPGRLRALCWKLSCSAKWVGLNPDWNLLISHQDMWKNMGKIWAVTNTSNTTNTLPLLEATNGFRMLYVGSGLLSLPHAPIDVQSPNIGWQCYSNTEALCLLGKSWLLVGDIFRSLLVSFWFPTIICDIIWYNLTPNTCMMRVIDT